MAEAPSKNVEIRHKVMLVSIDGWGIAPPSKGNAISNAKVPNMQAFEQKYKGTQKLEDNEHILFGELSASGLDVGLPAGIMGNSEVGHLTMGAGRVQFQDLVRINLAIEDKSFFKNAAFLNAFEYGKANNKRIHFLGLVSDGAVHSHIEHLKCLLLAAQENGVPEAYVHFFADGRDTPPSSAVKYIAELQDFFKQHKYGKIATVTGRYYAMDRDKRWERIDIAVQGIFNGKGDKTTADELVSFVKQRYEAKETDEFLKPIIVEKDGLIKDGDALIFFDFRSDRMREIVETVAVKAPYATDFKPNKLHVVQMTQYNSGFDLPIAFPPQAMDNGIAEWVSKHGLKQFHTAETEKYAHVTFFFNGGTEKAFALEDRKLVNSPKVATYDLKPEMSVHDVGKSVVEALGTGEYPFVMCNLAPPDMVGHTGVYDATVIACQETDQVIGEIYAACKKHGYVLVITADHGNAEEMLDEQGKPKTSHTTNLVPVIVAAQMPEFKVKMVQKTGGLKDIGPTVLRLLGLSVPKEMTGVSLIQ